MDGPPKPIPGVTPSIPPLGVRSSLDLVVVRAFIFDKSAMDNPLLMDLEFSDEELLQAQGIAVSAYNGIEPRVETFLPFSIPPQADHIMLNGIACYAQQAKLMNLMRNNLEYNAGNMEVDINAKRIAALTATAQMFKTEFFRTATDRKTTINVGAAYGNF